MLRLVGILAADIIYPALQMIQGIVSSTIRDGFLPIGMGSDKFRGSFDQDKLRFR